MSIPYHFDPSFWVDVIWSVVRFTIHVSNERSINSDTINHTCNSNQSSSWSCIGVCCKLFLILHDSDKFSTNTSITIDTDLRLECKLNIKSIEINTGDTTIDSGYPDDTLWAWNFSNEYILSTRVSDTRTNWFNRSNNSNYICTNSCRYNRNTSSINTLISIRTICSNVTR